MWRSLQAVVVTQLPAEPLLGWVGLGWVGLACLPAGRPLLAHMRVPWHTVLRWWPTSTAVRRAPPPQDPSIQGRATSGVRHAAWYIWDSLEFVGEVAADFLGLVRSKISFRTVAPVAAL